MSVFVSLRRNEWGRALAFAAQFCENSHFDLTLQQAVRLVVWACM